MITIRTREWIKMIKMFIPTTCGACPWLSLMNILIEPWERQIRTWLRVAWSTMKLLMKVRSKREIINGYYPWFTWITWITNNVCWPENFQVQVLRHFYISTDISINIVCLFFDGLKFQKIANGGDSDDIDCLQFRKLLFSVSSDILLHMNIWDCTMCYF